MVPVTVKVGRQVRQQYRSNGAGKPQPPSPIEVSTVFVDNFVDNGILMSGNHGSQTWHHRKPGKNSQLFLFKINDLKNAP
jgi:hypothetical protein